MKTSTIIVSLALLSLLQTGCGGASAIPPNKANISLEKETPLAIGSLQPGENQKR